MHYLEESHILLFLAQLFILLLATRGLGQVFERLGQPALTAELLVGVILGPTVLGRFLPQVHQVLFPADPIQRSMLETVAWIGVLFLLLETGLEIDFSIAWRNRGSAMVIALSDIIIPMVLGFIGMWFVSDRHLVHPHQRVVFSMFMATALTISAMPVTARVLHSLDLLKSEVGFITMSALAVNDVIGWVLFTMILGLFTRQSLEIRSLAVVLVSTVGFAAAALAFGRKASTGLIRAVQRAQLPEPGTSLTLVSVVGMLCGAITQWLGIHALFGFFIAGVVMGESKGLTEQTRAVISQMVHAIFVPLFFANIGLKIDFAGGFDLWLVALITVLGIFARYVGAWVGVTIAGLPRVDRDLISVGHTPGGMMEVVVALLALQAGLIKQSVFVAIVFGAVFSSVLVGPWMAYAMRRRRHVPASRFMSPELIVPDLEAGQPDQAIEELVGKIDAKRAQIDKDAVVQALVAREQEFSTGLGCGVAVPHCRTTGIKDPILAFGRSIKGLVWDSPDGEPVHFVFLLLTPAGADDLHVQIIAQIAKAMHNPSFRQALADAEDKEDLLAILNRAFYLSGSRSNKQKSL